MKNSFWVSFFIPHLFAIFLLFLPFFGFTLTFFFPPFLVFCPLSSSATCPQTKRTLKHRQESLHAMHMQFTVWSNTYWCLVLLLTQNEKMFKLCKTDIFPHGLSYLPGMAVMTRRTDYSSHTVTKIIADIFISLAWDFFIFIISFLLEKKKLSTYSASNAPSLLFYSLPILTVCPQQRIAVEKVIWYIQILLHYPIIIIILRVFRHICYGNCSSWLLCRAFTLTSQIRFATCRHDPSV